MCAEVAAPERGTYELGVSRPPLEVTDLPTPEEVFGVDRIGFKEVVKYAVGPSLIALGVSIGSGEWLLGPLGIGAEGGYRGLGIFITISILLQTFYNIEVSRYVVATGEVPIVGFGRTPPGAWLWIPLALLVFYFAFILGGWAAAAGQGLYALITGEAAASTEEPVRLLAILLILVVFAITLAAKKISRALELANWVMVGSIIVFLIVMDIFIVPAKLWGEAIVGLVTPALPPEGTSATILGGLVGFSALAGGLNWFLMGHYRDKGYGMGHRVGFIAGLRGERKEVLATGVTFPDDEKNSALWRRWYNYLKLDMWGVFFPFAILGMLLPTMLILQLSRMSGRKPTEETIPTFAADVLNTRYGAFLFYVALIVGVFILFSTQLGIFEALVRNFVDAANATSPRLRELLGGDPRRFYYPYMLFLAVIISIILHLAAPATLILTSANMSNLGAVLFPFVLMYLNSKLPRPARPGPWTYVVLTIFFLYFGFFFLNFVADTFFGGPLVEF